MCISKVWKEKLKGFRTVLINTALLLLPSWEFVVLLAQEMARAPELPSILPEKWLPLYAIFAAVVNIYMRTVTTTAIGRRD